jgi:hypothetical protein
MELSNLTVNNETIESVILSLLLDGNHAPGFEEVCETTQAPFQKFNAKNSTVSRVMCSTKKALVQYVGELYHHWWIQLAIFWKKGTAFCMGRREAKGTRPDVPWLRASQRSSGRPLLSKTSPLVEFPANRVSGNDLERARALPERASC